MQYVATLLFMSTCACMTITDINWADSRYLITCTLASSQVRNEIDKLFWSA